MSGGCRGLLVVSLLFWGGCAAARATSSKANPCPLGCRISCYGPYEADAFAHLASIGVGGVEIPVPRPDDAEAIRKKLAEHGLTALLLKAQADLSEPESVEALAQQIRICQAMGVSRMFLSARTNGADRNVVYDRLRQAGRIAGKYGVTIVLETHPDLATNGDVALETMRRIDHPNVRINFDTGNVTFYNPGTTAVAELKKIAPYVASVHLKDHTGGLEEWNFPALGQGVVDFPEVIRVLESHGFTGPFVMELEGVKGVRMNEAETKRYVAKSAAYLRTLGMF